MRLARPVDRGRAQPVVEPGHDPPREARTGRAVDEPDGEGAIGARLDGGDALVERALPLAGGDFPGDDAINAAAEEGCIAAFEPFVGAPYDTSELYIAWYAPTQQSWEAMGDRIISCTITHPSGPVTGTLAGAAH